MRMLITSGGTKVPIDSVRDITNMSRGTFGAKIAWTALMRNHQVHFFHAKDSRSPYKFEYDYFSNQQTDMSFEIWKEYCQKLEHQYQQSQFRNYQDYAENLERLVKEYNPEVTILSAAVSDYLVKPQTGKISGNTDISIDLFPAEKVISKIKTWNPNTFLVGFKLLVGVSDETLIEAARKSIVNNGCDLVVANDLNSLRAGKHRILLIDKDDIFEVDCMPQDVYLLSHIEHKTEGKSS